jgi:hypothetical protein
MFLVDGAKTTIKLENVKAKQNANRRSASKQTLAESTRQKHNPGLQDRRSRWTISTPVSTKPGSEESKRIADQIVDAIG